MATRSAKPAKPVVAKAPRGSTPKLPPRNLVILLDGTGNELGRNLSNVLKLYRLTEKGEKQLVFYNPGVGTIGRTNPWRRLRQKAWGILGLATGYGLDENVLSAHKFLVQNWREGDQIYLFGFSRGAWTARVLAGFIHLVGLLRPEQLNMCDSALGAYKRAAADRDLPFAWHLSRVISVRYPKIRFIGARDSVGSVLVPRRDRFWVPSLETLPYTETNPSVEIFRHALALDERRRMFRVARWTEPQDFVRNRFQVDTAIPQDIEQRWFAGVHSDIGGGYPESESGLSKFPLIWMVEEAVKAGLRITQANFQHLAWGKPQAESEHDYVAPSATAISHRSLTWGWWPLEIFPKRTKERETRKRSFSELYVPFGKRRKVEPYNVDQSVQQRKAASIDYKPANL